MQDNIAQRVLSFKSVNKPNVRRRYTSTQNKPPTTMIIWKGKGIVVIILFVIGYWITSFAANSIWSAGYTASHDWVSAAGIALGSIFCWFAGVSLERRGTRVVIDKATGREITLRSSNSLFFIPVKWWALVGLLAAGFVLAFGVPSDDQNASRKQQQEERAK